MKTFLKINAVIAAVGLVLTIIGFTLFAFSWKSYSVETVSYEETVSADDWNRADTLKIEAGFASLHIMKGKEVKLVADEVPEKLAAHLTADGEIVSLKSGSIRGSDLIKSSGVSINSAGTYTLYVPDYIENLEVSFSFGELKITDIYAKNADMEIAYSDSVLNLGVTDMLDIDVSFGDTDIDILTRECSKLALASSFGNCDIKNARIKETASIDNSFGDLDVQLLGNDYDINSSSSFGESSIEGSRRDGSVKINITNSFGDTEVCTDDVPEFIINN